MDTVGNVTMFLSEGAGVESIVAELEQSGAEVPRDPFGHVKLDEINPGQWFAKQFAARLGAEKVLVQKSGYFARSAPADETDLMLIKSMTDFAVDSALRGDSRRHRPRRGARRRAAGDRVRPDQGRQAVRHLQRRVRRAAVQDRPAGDGRNRSLTPAGKGACQRRPAQGGLAESAWQSRTTTTAACGRVVG